MFCVSGHVRGRNVTVMIAGPTFRWILFSEAQLVLFEGLRSIRLYLEAHTKVASMPVQS
jgi:hypothetical protein